MLLILTLILMLINKKFYLLDVLIQHENIYFEFYGIQKPMFRILKIDYVTIKTVKKRLDFYFF